MTRQEHHWKPPRRQHQPRPSQPSLGSYLSAVEVQQDVHLQRGHVEDAVCEAQLSTAQPRPLQPPGPRAHPVWPALACQGSISLAGAPGAPAPPAESPDPTAAALTVPPEGREFIQRGAQRRQEEPPGLLHVARRGHGPAARGQHQHLHLRCICRRGLPWSLGTEGGSGRARDSTRAPGPHPSNPHLSLGALCAQAALQQPPVPLLQPEEAEVPPQLLRLRQVAQHLLREAAGEARPHLLHHSPFQPGGPLRQQPVPQVQPAEPRVRAASAPRPPAPPQPGRAPAGPRSPGAQQPFPPQGAAGAAHSPVEVLEGVGELQAAEDDKGLQDLLQLPRAAHSPVQLLHLLIQVAGEPLAHLRRDGDGRVGTGRPQRGRGTGRSPGALRRGHG